MRPFTMLTLAEAVGGQWVSQPQDLTEEIQHFALYNGELRRDIGANNLLFATSHEHWLKGTMSSGVYTSTFTDNHEQVRKQQKYLKMAIVEHPVTGANVPQLVVPNAFDALETVFRMATKTYAGKTISVTGSVGKSTTKTFIAALMRHLGSTMSSVGNHNSRTSVKVQVMNHEQGAYNVLEIAGMGLSYQEPDGGIGGVAALIPMDLAVLTQVDAGQKGWSPDKTADMKTRMGVNLKRGRPFLVNAEIKNLDVVEKDVHRFTDTMVTYGMTADCDYYGQLAEDGTLTFYHHQQLLATLNVSGLDHGTVIDMLAALAVYDMEGGAMTAAILADFSKIAAQTTTHKVMHFTANDRQVTIIDDTHNAELLSIENFITFAEKYPVNSNTRKIFIEGRVRDLRQYSYQTHSKVMTQLNTTHFDAVYLYGPEMDWVIPNLNSDLFGGYYTTPEQVLMAIAQEPLQDLVIFIKADSRASTIDQIGRTLARRLAYQAGATSAFAMSHVSEKRDACARTGVGRLLVILKALQAIAQGRLKLTQPIKMTTELATDPSVNKVGLTKGTAYMAYDLISLAIVAPAPDIVINLAEYLFGGNHKALVGLQQMAQQLGLSARTVENITGRYTRKPQRTYLSDLEKIGAAYCKLPNEAFNLLNTQQRTFKGKFYQKRTQLLKTNQIVGSVFQDNHEQAGLLFTNNATGKHAIAFLNSPHFATVDALMSAWLTTGERTTAPIEPVILDQPIINFLGDTYFGEDYTRRRQRQGIDDALQRYGYQHSFEELAPFFTDTAYNVFNFEAVFADGTSPLKGMKPYILDADQAPTLAELKRVGFNLAMLSNNHANDFGPENLMATKRAFESAGIATIGAGEDQTQARKIIEFQYQNQRVALFNGYWYRNQANNFFDFYAHAGHAGVNGLETMMAMDIEAYKVVNPSAKVIVSAHWGTDFAPIKPAQRSMAQRLALAGADLIIGHGPHRLQPIEYWGTTPILYSIGNGVFNSNGEFKQRQVPAYGATVRLNLAKQELYWCPIYADNLKTFWQPAFVTDEDFAEICQWNAPRFATTKIDGRINAVVVPF